MKNTKEIESKIEELRSKRNLLMKIHIDPLSEEISKLRKDRIASIVNNREYLTDLSDFEGKNLSNIVALDSKGKEIYLPLDQIVEVRCGKLHCSGLYGGIIAWSNKDNCYKKRYYYKTENLDIVGFTDIEVEED